MASADTPYRAPTEPPPSPLARLASHGAVYTLASLVARTLSIVMVPIYTHLLGPADLGALELVDTLDLVVIATFSTALTDPVLRHFHDAPDGEARDAVVSTAILSVIGAGTLIAIAGSLASPALAGAVFHDRGRASLFVFTFLSVTFQAVVEVPFAVLRNTGSPWRVAAWSLARAVVGLALNVGFIVGMRLGVLGVVLSNFAASTAVALAMTGLTLRRTGLRFDAGALRRMMRFGWPMIPGAIAMIAIGHSRSYVLNAYVPLAEVGVWAFGYRFGAMISQALGHPLRSAWTAQMYAIWDAPDGRGPEHYRRAGTWIVALFAWAAAALSAFAPEIVALFAPGTFRGAVVVIPAVAWAYALREVAEYFRNGLLVGRNARAIAWVEPGLAIVDLALGVALVSRYGLTGAVIATPLVFAVYAFAMHRAARAVLPVRYEYGRMAACALIALALGAAGFSLHTGRTLADVVAKAGLIALVPVAMVALVLRDPEERALLAALRKRLRV
jgi:O-antigen/teichoic acid export membrane protein